jgi:hypothetical protein
LDLFDDDKRLALASVVAFNKLLEQAFADGECTCVRCKESTASPFGSGPAHTFDVHTGKVARKFVQTVPADVEAVLKKAYKAFYKAELPVVNEALLGDLEAMASQNNAGRVKVLLEVTGLLGSAEAQAGIGTIGGVDPNLVLETDPDLNLGADFDEDFERAGY